MKKVIKKLSFKKAEIEEINSWKKMSLVEKLNIVQTLREEYFTFKNENRTGLQRVYKITKLEQC